MSEEKPQPEATSRPAAADETRAPAAARPAVEPAAAPDRQAQELVAWNEQVRRRMRRQTRRAFLGLGAGAVATFGVFEWLTSRRQIDGVPWPFRKTLETNEQLARDYFRTKRLAPTFGPDRAGEDRVNGDVGLEEAVDAAAWKLEVQGLASQDEPLTLALDAIQALPRVEMTTEL